MQSCKFDLSGLVVPSSGVLIVNLVSWNHDFNHFLTEAFTSLLLRLKLLFVPSFTQKVKWWQIHFINRVHDLLFDFQESCSFHQEGEKIEISKEACEMHDVPAVLVDVGQDESLDFHEV